MNRIIMFASCAVACLASAQLIQVPAPAPVPVVQPQTMVVQQPVVQQVTTTVQPVQQVTTTVVQPATTVVQPATTIVVPAGYQMCPRCEGRGKEEHALGFKVKRCKLCDGKGYLLPAPPPPAPSHHHRHHRH